MVRRDRGPGGDARILRGPGGAGAGCLPRRLGRAHRSLVPGRPGHGLGPVGTAARAAGRALSGRQHPARADGARRCRPHQRGSSPADELVPVPRARLTPVPPLPEPPVHDLGPRRHGRGPRHRVPLVPLPAPGAVADHRLLERPALRAEPLDRRRGRRGRAVPRLGRRHRLRDQGVRVGGLRRVDPAVGLVDAAAGVGLHVQGADDVAGGLLGRPLHHADRRPALRDGLSRLGPARRLALHRAVGPVASDRPRRGDRGGGRAGVGLGHRPVAAAVPLGGAQPGARGHGPRERLRRAAKC